MELPKHVESEKQGIFCDRLKTTKVAPLNLRNNELHQNDKIKWPELSPSVLQWDKTYDGLICRWPHGQTMINCIGLKKYEVRPYEVFIAKPTGMSKVDCCNFATPVLKHLLDTSIVSSICF